MIVKFTKMHEATALPARGSPKGDIHPKRMVHPLGACT